MDVLREDWVFASYPGQIITTPHYRIHTTVDYPHITDALPSFLEFALTQYRRALADLPAPPRRMETYLFADRRQWSGKTRQMLPDQSATFQHLGRGGFTTRGTAILYYIDYNRRGRDTLAIAAHEGWHQYTQSTFRTPLPIWLEEGIATYMEGCRIVNGNLTFRPWQNWERRRTLGEAIRDDRLIPLAELLNARPQAYLGSGQDQLLTYYAQVWALTRFLADGAKGRYRAPLGSVLTDAAKGSLIRHVRRSPDVSAAVSRHGGSPAGMGSLVILAYFNNDLSAFENEYLAYARTLAQGGPTRGWQERRRTPD